MAKSLMLIRSWRTHRALHGWAIATFIAMSAGGWVTDAHAGSLSIVSFTEDSPLSSNDELARRMLSPLTAVRLQRALAHSGKALGRQPIAIGDEKFVVYVPTQPPPPGGYALLVFVPPWDDAQLPDDWGPALDQFGVIFVSAARSGNKFSDLGRREPLALAAEQNVSLRYKIDRERIYIAGFSGGARVAMKLALGYPDVFRGAILNAGSDPIGSSQVPLPPRSLFQQFQNSTRLVYITGDADSAALVGAIASMGSMRESCVFNLKNQITPFVGHAVADSAALSRALQALSEPLQPDLAKLAQCRSALEQDLGARFQKVELLLSDGRLDESQKALIEIDARFGGLAAPRSVELMK